MRYFMRWPILDHGLSLSVLHAEATDDLAAELDAKRLIAMGPIEFHIEDIADDDGERLELHAAVECKSLAPWHTVVPPSPRSDKGSPRTAA